ncbi:MAG: ABC transporter ATP-binding protein [Terriglobales bacterium]
MIAAEGLTIGRVRKPLLDSIGFRLPAGECWAVAGRNGSGKSTLLATLAGLLPPLAGKVHVLDRPLAAWRRSDLALHLGYLPQLAPLVFPYTIEEFVGLARAPWGGRGLEAVDDAIQSLELEGISGRVLTALSGGELQRACIAHLLAQTTRILLLDEPMAHLDLLHQLRVMQLLRASADRGGAVAVVTHDLGLAWPYCDRFLLLGPGGLRLVARSDHGAMHNGLHWAYGVDFEMTRDGPLLSPSTHLAVTKRGSL